MSAVQGSFSVRLRKRLVCPAPHQGPDELAPSGRIASASHARRRSRTPCRPMAALSEGCIDMLTINLETARGVIEAVETKARSLDCPVNIAVVDAGGNLVAHVRMDDARIGAIDIAINKAWSARAFDMETAELGRYSQPGAPFFGIHASNGGRVMLLAGGAPLRHAGQIIGALGVSGGSGEQDSACANAGVQAMASLLDS